MTWTSTGHGCKDAACEWIAAYWDGHWTGWNFLTMRDYDRFCAANPTGPPKEARSHRRQG